MSSMLEAGAAGDVNAPRHRTTPPAEAVDRVLATAADLAVTGRRISARQLALLTWLEPDTIDACLDQLCTTGRLVRVGPRGQQFTFPKDRWPPPEAASASRVSRAPGRG